jgi:hypothetical protein
VIEGGTTVVTVHTAPEPASDLVVLPELTFDSTVPRQLVHKHAVEAVYITDSVALSDSEFVCAAVLPRANTPSARASSQQFCRYDLAMLIELGRQAAFVVAHRHQEVPVSHSTLLSTIGLELLDTTATGPMLTPSRVLIKIRGIKKVNQRGRVVGGDYVLDVVEGDRVIARMTAAGSVAAPEKYKIARLVTREALMAKGWDTPAPLPLVEPAAVGRDQGAGILVSAMCAGVGPRHFTAQMFVDSTDLFFFDHPIDHVPGIVSCEAIRQAAVLAACQCYPELSPKDVLVRRFQGEFSGFGEADLPLAVDITVGDADVAAGAGVLAISAAVTQVGESVVRAQLELEFRPQ